MPFDSVCEDVQGEAVARRAPNFAKARGVCLFCKKPIPNTGTKEKKFCTSLCKEKHRIATRGS